MRVHAKHYIQIAGAMGKRLCQNVNLVVLEECHIQSTQLDLSSSQGSKLGARRRKNQNPQLVRQAYSL